MIVIDRYMTRSPKIAALIAGTLTWTRRILLGLGAVFVLFYTFPLKYIGLGELAVLVGQIDPDLELPPVFRLSTLITPVVADVPEPIKGADAALLTVRAKGAPSTRASPPVFVVELAMVVDPTFTVVVL